MFHDFSQTCLPWNHGFCVLKIAGLLKKRQLEIHQFWKLSPDYLGFVSGDFFVDSTMLNHH